MAPLPFFPAFKYSKYQVKLASFNTLRRIRRMMYGKHVFSRVSFSLAAPTSHHWRRWLPRLRIADISGRLLASNYLASSAKGVSS